MHLTEALNGNLLIGLYGSHVWDGKQEIPALVSVKETNMGSNVGLEVMWSYLSFVKQLES